MRALVSHLACLMLAAHLVLGCCWHHAHACETAGHDGPSQHGIAGDHHHDADHEQHAPSVPGHCHGEQCSFLVVGKVQLTGGCGIPLPIGAVATKSTTAAMDLGWPTLTASGSDRPPPVRLHLLHQVVRI